MGTQAVKHARARRRGLNKRVRKREEKGAEEIGGRKTPGSGSGVVKGDFRNEEYMVEDKLTGAKSFRVTENMINKMVGQATRTGRVGILRIGMPGVEVGVMLWADIKELICEEG